MEIKSVKSIILEYLRGKIIVGEIAPGEKLNEISLSRELGISRPPLREAFQILEQEYLIVSVPRKGRCVTEISKANFESVFEIRKMIEISAIDLLHVRGKRDLAEVENALKLGLEMPVPPSEDKDQKIRYMSTTELFHIKLIQATGNPLLQHFYHIIRSNIARYKYLFLFHPGLTSRITEEHSTIMSHIRSREYRKAKVALLRHLEEGYELLSSKL